MQACLSSSSPVGQSIKPSHRTWSSMQWYLPILSAVGQANLSIPSSETGHSVNRIARILLQSVCMKLTLYACRTGIMHMSVTRYLGQIGKIAHERYRGIGKTYVGEAKYHLSNIKTFGFPYFYYFGYCFHYFVNVYFFPTMFVRIRGILLFAVYRNKHFSSIIKTIFKTSIIIGSVATQLPRVSIFHFVNCGN